MTTTIITVKELLKKNGLNIPEYQRPYKWTLININQLIDDVLIFKNKSTYRLGTIVIHKDKDKLEIVDGQQRITTIILLLKAIEMDEKLKNRFKDNYGKKFTDEVTFPTLKFSNPISLKNIKENFLELQKRVKEIEFDETIIYFLLNHCEVVYIELDDITEAFQFFDSQNSRGKDLAPHDLLKAYHLREMSDVSENEKTKLIEEWEELDEKGELSKIFDNYLFRIRSWSRGKSARYFTKDDVSLFKGISVNQDTKELYPYALLYQMANIFVDNYNRDSSRGIDFNKLSYPFSLDLPILNGKRFFEMISHYYFRIDKIKKFENLEKINGKKNIIELLDTYKGNHRTGDRYVRSLFECALIYYIDKFGEKELDKVVKKLFIWAYTLRLELQAVKLASMDNRALHSNVFKIIKDANTHSEVINMHIKSIDNIKYEISELKDIFEELGYLS